MQPISENAVNTPAFLGKLWKMVNDPSTDHLICWSATGNSFVIQNQAQFWYELLPLYYKHNNMSSFVRQLNMYGFHKMSTVENGTMDADKDEIQFTHPYFQKDKPELLRNIKRKATTAKTNENNNKHDELTKVLTDVKQLRGRQASVDSQLNAMKQENALLWQEVAVLRQKHIKQQKIVNKLIQFLVSLVQPSRMTVGVKRGYQLMLHEGPNKKPKIEDSKTNSNSEGPTIHELDNELDLTTNLYEEEPPLAEDPPAETNNDMINSPAPSTVSQHTDLNSPLSAALLDVNGDNCDAVWDKPEYVIINPRSTPDELLLNDNDLNDENLINTLENEVTPILTTAPQKVFLNPATQDTLLSNLMKPIVKIEENGKNAQIVATTVERKESNAPARNDSKNNSVVATRDHNFSDDIIKSMPSTSDSYGEDLTSHIESAQSELDQFKDILNCYNSYVDANTLLGELNKIPQNYKNMNLFANDSPELINENKNSDNLIDPTDPLVSGSELTPYVNNFDFNELFDDDIDAEANTTVPTLVAASSAVNTPQVLRDEPLFPVVSKNN